MIKVPVAPIGRLPHATAGEPYESPWTCERGFVPSGYNTPTCWDCLDCEIGEACYCATPRRETL